MPDTTGLSDFASSHPFLFQLSNMDTHPDGLLGGLLWRRAQKLKQQGMFGAAPPVAPQTPAPAVPAAPAAPAATPPQPSGARLGQLFSGYGY